MLFDFLPTILFAAHPEHAYLYSRGWKRRPSRGRCARFAALPEL